jgi:hypothetical protein
MSQFSSLMNQYGSEAETAKVAEHRADQRSATFRKVRSVCLLLVVVASFAAAAVYRNEVQSAIARVTDKFHAPTPYAKAEGNTKNRIADISKEAEQRKEAVEATFK